MNLRATAEQFDGLGEKVLALFCLVAGVAGLYLAQDPMLWDRWVENVAPIEVVGHLEQAEGAVRHRSSDSLLWRDLVPGKSKRQPLGDGDALFTGGNGKAEIEVEGVEVSLAPGALVIVSKSVPISLQDGKISLALMPNQPAIKIDLRGRIFELATEGAGGPVDLSLAGSAESATISSAVEQRIRIRSGGAELTLNAPGSLSVDAPSAKPRSGRGSSGSLEMSKLVAANPAAAKPLPANPVAAFQPILVPKPIEIAKPLETPLAKPVAAPSVAPVRLPEVQLKDVLISTRLASSFGLHELTAELKWAEVKGATLYGVEVSMDGRKWLALPGQVPSKSPRAMLKVSDPTKAWKYYRVIATLGTRRDAPVVRSLPKSIRITRDAPEPVQVVVDTESSDGRVTLVWRSTVLTKRYRYQISKSPSFDALIEDRTTAKNVGEAKLRSGDYHWRIRSEYVDGVESGWSVTGKFSVAAD